MKNFPIDAILKVATLCGFISVYTVAGTSALKHIRLQPAVPPVTEDASLRAVTSGPTLTQTISPTPQKVPKLPSEQHTSPIIESVTETPDPTPDTRCIISVDGASYNITEFRQKHSGGDIFTCGADMSATFHGQHDTQILQKMNQYKI